MTGTEVRRTAVGGTLSLACSIGEAVLAARSGRRDPAEAVLGAAGGRRLFTGKVGDVERRMAGGFARGTLRLDGLDGHAGESLVVDFQNENLIATTGDGHVLAVVPDLISLVDVDAAEPVTTEIVRYGMRVTVLGIPAPATLTTPRALAVVGPRAFGYDVPYTPLGAGHGSGAR